MTKVLSVGLAVLLGGCLQAAHPKEAEAPGLRPVVVQGYDGDTMEPFVSRDGRYLLFNNLNDPSVNTDIFYAARKDDLTWRFRGPVRGIATPELEGCPTMDRQGRLFFVSPRDYPKTLCTIYSGQFRDGAVTDLRMEESISVKVAGRVNFDVDVSPDGGTLVFVDSAFKPGSGPEWAKLVLAKGEGKWFVRSPESARLLAEVNAGTLQYAPTISADGRTLYFTRVDPRTGFPGPQIYRAVRKSVGVPFERPTRIKGLGEFVEGSCLSPDERLLYFHRRDGERFRLYAVPVR